MIKRYIPGTICKEILAEIYIENHEIVTTNNFALIKAFYDITSRPGNITFTKNSGAIQWFNKYTGLPIQEALHGVSDGEYATSFGHSERTLVCDTLDVFIPKDNKEIKRPSDCCKSNNAIDQKKEILKNLTEEAGCYKQYLTKQNIVINMWSDRQPCYNFNENKKFYTEEAGGTCKEFVNNICPEGSQYIYIAEKMTALATEEASKSFQQDYLNYASSEIFESDDLDYSDLDPSGLISLFGSFGF